MKTVRERQRQEFLGRCGLEHARDKPLVQDASFRRYFRIDRDGQSWILMDAPPAHEDTRPFVAVARHLLDLGLHPPQPLQVDTRHGFILLEDLGEATFTRLLRDGADEQALYTLALETLLRLQSHARSSALDVPAYSAELLVQEALLLCDWYFPRYTGGPISATARSAFIECWINTLQGLPTLPDTLVLRDYHVDNLMRLEGGSCGLLDFQDAVIGSPAYDLVSLLEDARRDVDPALQEMMLERYFAARPEIPRDAFMRGYHVLGAQRHCKVLGIFTRLSVRDGKHRYLDHLPRVQALLDASLGYPELQPLNYWLCKYMRKKPAG